MVIEGSARESVGAKNAKELRDNGLVPCVVYGGETEKHISIDERVLEKLISTPIVYLAEIKIGDETVKAIIKDIQYHPVTDRFMHIDFLQVFEDKAVTVALPVKTTGNSIGVKAGGKLRINARKLKVSGLLKDLPENLEVAIDNLNIGQLMRVRDLKFANLTVLDAASDVVVSIKATRGSKAA